MKRWQKILLALVLVYLAIGIWFTLGTDWYDAPNIILGFVGRTLFWPLIILAFSFPGVFM